MIDIETIIRKNLCLGCGACSYDQSILKMVFDLKKGFYLPIINESNHKIADQICPAKGYSIIDDAKKLYPTALESVELGRYYELFVGHSNNSLVLKNASSGGMMTEFLTYLLDKSIVDYVAVTKFHYTKNGPTAKTFLTNNKSDLIESQGSKYCPVDISEVIEKIQKTEGRIAYVGTPCQIAGIRNIQKIDQAFKDKVVLTISNFCGGIKSYNFIKQIAKRHSINYKKITTLRYRGGGQPGSMFMKDTNDKAFEASYKLYGGYSGYSKLLRCHFCVDATGELADISFGDAWLDKYLNDKNPWSVMIARTSFVSEIIKQMHLNNHIDLRDVTYEEICLSQKTNLNSKKQRQYTRYSLYKKLGYLLPEFDGGYFIQQTSIKTELLVFFKHKFTELLERIGLYKIYRILIGKGY